MRICYLGWANYIHVERWAKWFSNNGHEVHIVTHLPKSIPNVVVHNIQHIPDPRPRFQRYRQLNFNIFWVQECKVIYNMRELIREINPDILHSHSLYYPAYLGGLCDIQPYVITLWNEDDSSGKIYAKNSRGFYEKFLIRHALKRACSVNCSTKLMFEYAKRLGIDEKNFYLFDWGTDLSMFNPFGDRTAIKRRLGIQPDTKVVISTRNLDNDWYNIDTIVKAIPSILCFESNVNFLFLWNVVLKRSLMEINQLIKDLQISDKVRLIGKVSYEELADYYRIADVYISIPFKDGRSMSAGEAMACGAIPVVSDIPAMREWVEDGARMFLVNPKDPGEVAKIVTHILKDGAMQSAFAADNWQVIQRKGDFNKNMRIMESHYESLLKRLRS